MCSRGKPKLFSSYRIICLCVGNALQQAVNPPIIKILWRYFGQKFYSLNWKKSDLLCIIQFNPDNPNRLHFKLPIDGVRLKGEQKVVDTIVWFPHSFGFRYWLYCSFATILQVTTVDSSLACWLNWYVLHLLDTAIPLMHKTKELPQNRGS